MSSGNKILNLLSSNTLINLYDGHSEGILLVLDKRVISGGLIRLKVRDAVHMDGAVAGSPEQLGEVKVGDIRYFSSSIRLNNTNWIRSLVPGRGMLVARIEEVDMTGLPVAQVLDDHKTCPVLN